jgi:hypothetical protein
MLVLSGLCSSLLNLLSYASRSDQWEGPFKGVSPLDNGIVIEAWAAQTLGDLDGHLRPSIQLNQIPINNYITNLYIFW